MLGLCTFSHEARVIAHVEIEVSLQRVPVQHRPAAAAHGSTFIEAFPGELQRPSSVALGPIAVHGAVHSSKLKPSASVGIDLHVGLGDKIEEILVPLVRLYDAERPGELCCSLHLKRSSSLMKFRLGLWAARMDAR
mgnify:FL=1